jgi:uncharacterized repeat protein (TIGR02543 family)
MKKSRFFRCFLAVVQIIAMIIVLLPLSNQVSAISGYTITYDGNGSTSGDVPIDLAVYDEGDIATLLANSGNLQKDGRVFAGWTLIKDDVNVLKPGDSVTFETANLTVYAKWDPILIVDYNFDNNLIDQRGNSELIPFTTENDGYSRNNATSGFGQDDAGSYWYWTSTLSRGGGFKIDVDQSISTSYSIGVRFSFNTMGSGYRKIIDYKNSASDTGFYFLGGSLNFYPYGTGSTTVAANQVVDIIATRKDDGLFTAYFIINGTLYKELELNSGSEAIPSIVDGKVRFGFFFDDIATGSEATSGGKVYSVRVWNGPISSVVAETAMEPTYTVSFDSDSDTVIATQTIKKDQKAIQPADPVKIGHTFLGWYHHVGQGWMAFDFDTPITENVQLKALWQINQYLVRFLDHDDTLISESLIDHGSDATAPADPIREGWQFKGWDLSLTNITSPRTLRATYKSLIQTVIEDDGVENLDVESSNLDQAVMFDEEDLDEIALIRLKVKQLTLQEMSQDEVDLLQDYTDTLGSSLTFTYLLLDISLFKEVGEEISPIEQALELITIKLKIPEFLQGKNFKLIRIHQGILEELSYQLSEDLSLVTFATDKFSTYAFVLGEQSEQPPLPDTGDQGSMGWVLLWLGLILLLISYKKVKIVSI